MEKYEVFFGSGEALDEVVTNASGRKISYHPYDYCDYMIVKVENEYGDKIELYAQVDPNDYGFCDGTVDGWNEQTAYDDLKAEIIKQAVENGIDPDCLKFQYD